MDATKLKPGTVLRLINGGSMAAPVGSLAVFHGVHTKYLSKKWINIRWLHDGFSNQHRQMDGAYPVTIFEVFKQDDVGGTAPVPKERAEVGDIVKYKNDSDEERIGLVVMTDEARGTVDSEYKKLFRALMVDGAPGTHERVDERYIQDPMYVYVVCLTNPGSYWDTGPTRCDEVEVIIKHRDITEENIRKIKE